MEAKTNLWTNLKAAHKRPDGSYEPILVLAPMADVTDAAFRRVIAAYGKPDVMWTEFVSADGLVRAPEAGKAILMKDLIFVPEERPIVAQLFTSNPDHMRQAAALVQSLGFDGLDINMGCPAEAIERQGAGAAHIKDAKTAQAVIRAAQEGAPNLPISVKTRVGYNKVSLDEWLPEILETKPAMVTIHARTRKEMSKVPARWEHVKEAVALRDRLSPETLIFGNGDVVDTDDACGRAAETGADGVMLGRAIFGNPWLFSKTTKRDDVPVAERLRVMLEHTRLYDSLFRDIKSFAVMKKHYKAYVNGFDGAAELRAKLMEAGSADEVENIVKEWLELQKT